jgi:hypothetical protein
VSEKYHISLRTGRPALCEAVKRRCQYDSAGHYDSVIEAKGILNTSTISEAIRRSLILELPPIIVPKSLITVPQSDTNHEIYSGVEVGIAHYPTSSDEFEVRDVYSYEEALRGYFSTGYTKALPNELHKLAKELKLYDPSAYKVCGVRGYYGDEAEIYFEDEVKAKLEEWAYSNNNAEDWNNVLDYCHSKGLNTTGLTPIEAIKTQLKEEYKNFSLPYGIREAKYLIKTNIPVEEIQITNKTKLDHSSPKPILSKTNRKPIAGVLISNGYKKYTLVDGYRRFKTLQQNNNSEGSFIVLSRDKKHVNSLAFLPKLQK